MRAIVVGVIGLALVVFACTLIGLDFFLKLHSPGVFAIVREFASQIIAIGAILIGLYLYLKSKGH